MDQGAKSYQERLKRVSAAFRNEKPDRVPVFSLATTYVYTSQGFDPIEGYRDPEMAKKIHLDYYNNLYVDGCGGPHASNARKVEELMGGGIYEYKDDGTYQVRPKSIKKMEDHEYDELIASPHRFFIDKIWPRRFDLMAKEYSPEKYEQFVAALEENGKGGKVAGPIAKALEEEASVPCMFVGGLTNPVDLIFDYLRDFDGTMRDIKKRPEQVRDAGLAMVDWMLQLATMGPPHPDKMLVAPMHLPTFLNPKDFEKVYWPSWKKLAEEVTNRGYRIVYLFEGKYEHLYEFMQDLPKNKIAGVFEHDDLKKTKEKLGETLCICGGMPTSLIQNKTKQQCIDQVKEVIDTIAVDGGFILTSDIPMMFKNDGKLENYRAVNEFVHEYGVYK
jgi:uroporphyrinogen-III decarboxylase